MSRKRYLPPLEHIQAYIKGQKLTDDAFAKLVGISPSYWSLISKGKRSLTTNVMVLIIRTVPDPALNKSLRWHLEGG